MLEKLKRFFNRERVGPSEAGALLVNSWLDVAEWAGACRYHFKRTRDGQGFVVDASFEGQPWRLEWGPSQRPYIDGHELRLRMELMLPSGLQMLVLNRVLLESLENESFERYTEVNQTQVDVSTSEEMRWVALFAASDLATQRSLKPHFAALSRSPAHVDAWLQGALTAALTRTMAAAMKPELPFVLMTLRGRVYMRTALAQPAPAVLNAMASLFTTACTEALRVSKSNFVEGTPSEAADTSKLGDASTAWPSPFEAKK